MVPLAVSLAALGGCLGDTMTGLDLPAGTAAFQLVVDTVHTSFHLVDTASTTGARFDYELTWLPQLGFGGTNCIGLLAHSPTDTTGSLYFVSTGSNYGVARRRNNAVTDTTFFGILFQGQGSRGGYAVNSSGKLVLTWADGSGIQFFDPAADIQLHGDTITSHAELSYLADSVHYSWRMMWVRSACQ